MSNGMIDMLRGEAARQGQGLNTYQRRVMDWMGACFADDITNDPLERAFRLTEETLELAQAEGCTEEQARALVAYVFARPVGEPRQEVGGVAVCLAALCGARGYDLADCAETELARCWTKIDAIRAKHAAKPKDVRCALPGQPSSGEQVHRGGAEGPHAGQLRDLNNPESSPPQGTGGGEL